LDVPGHKPRSPRILRRRAANLYSVTGSILVYALRAGERAGILRGPCILRFTASRLGMRIPQVCVFFCVAAAVPLRGSSACPSVYGAKIRLRDLSGLRVFFVPVSCAVALAVRSNHEKIWLWNWGSICRKGVIWSFRECFLEPPGRRGHYLVIVEKIMSTDLNMWERVLWRFGAELGAFPELSAIYPDGRPPALRLVAVIAMRQRMPCTNYAQIIIKNPAHCKCAASGDVTAGIVGGAEVGISPNGRTTPPCNRLPQPFRSFTKKIIRACDWLDEGRCVIDCTLEKTSWL
jgi:hypothetical protein